MKKRGVYIHPFSFLYYQDGWGIEEEVRVFNEKEVTVPPDSKEGPTREVKESFMGIEYSTKERLVFIAIRRRGICHGNNF